MQGTNSISPPPLKKGDTIGVFAPSSVVNKDDIEKSTRFLEDKGYKVFIHPQTYEQEHQSAGNHLQKTLAFQGLWQRGDIAAIWAAGGGNRCLHLLETINFNRLKNNLKHLIGFSDVTALLNAVYAHTNITTIHGPVFKHLHKYKQWDELESLLQGKSYIMPMNADNILHNGTGTGTLIGGNLSIFQYLPQTLNGEFCKDAILFLEDCNEELSRIDRMLLHLKRLGIFSNINALVFGQFDPIKDTGTPFGYTLEEIIREHTEGLNIQILYNMPFGHTQDLYPLPIGKIAKIDTKNNLFAIATE